MPTIMAQATIQHLRTILAQFGLPKRVVSDNGPTFISCEFKNFLHLNEFEYVMYASYHPATNGLVERALQTFKGGVKKLNKGGIQDKSDARYKSNTHIHRCGRVHLSLAMNAFNTNDERVYR